MSTPEVVIVGRVDEPPRSSEDLRPSWDETWLAVAEVVARRSTCPRAAVGAVVVLPNNQVLSTGYNGAPRKQDHCVDVGCILVDDGSCVRTVHAELNALHRAGSSSFGATLYTTTSPCWRCVGAIVQAGISRVVYSRKYRDVPGYPDPVETMRDSGIVVQEGS